MVFLLPARFVDQVTNVAGENEGEMGVRALSTAEVCFIQNLHICVAEEGAFPLVEHYFNYLFFNFNYQYFLWQVF
jgi:hypothetical protein